MVVSQGEIWWAELSEPPGSESGVRRPVVIVQGNPLNRSRLKTALCIPLTSNMKWAEAPGNLRLPKRSTGLSKDSVALSALAIAVDRGRLSERVGRISHDQLELIFLGLDLVLDR